MPTFNALGTGIARPPVPVAPRPSPQPMTYGAPPLQGPSMGAPSPSFGRPLPGLGATPASPNYGRAPQGQDPMAGQQMLARGRANTMPQTSAPPTSALPNPQRDAGSGAGPMVTNVGGKMFYR